MQNLLNRHYLATENRGKINEKTTIRDFFAKMHEEDTEMLNEGVNFELKEENHLAQETIDSIMVRVNMLKRLGFDFMEELEKNVIHQETRKD